MNGKCNRNKDSVQTQIVARGTKTTKHHRNGDNHCTMCTHCMMLFIYPSGTMQNQLPLSHPSPHLQHDGIRFLIDSSAADIQCHQVLRKLPQRPLQPSHQHTLKPTCLLRPWRTPSAVMTESCTSLMHSHVTATCQGTWCSIHGTHPV